jgi:NTE family protein
MDGKKYKTIVLSGGSIRGLALLGCLQYLQDRNILQDIDTFIGTSMGAILSYFISIGYTPSELIRDICQSSWLRDLKNKISVYHLITKKGILNYHESMMPYLETFTYKKRTTIPTLLQIYNDYGKELVMCTYNLTERKEYFVSYKTHPDLNCLIALQMTSSLPFLFEPFFFQDHLYIDGAVLNNFPIHYHQLDQDTDSIIGISIMTPQEETQRTSSIDIDFLDYVWSIITVPLHYIYENIKSKILSSTSYDIIEISLHNHCSLFHFSISRKDILDLFSDGYEQIKAYYSPLSTKIDPF